MHVSRLAGLAAAVVLCAGAGIAAATASAGGGNPPGSGHGQSAAPAAPAAPLTPDCRSTTWDVTLSSFTGYHMSPLVKCKTNLSGNASVDGGCTATITGTLVNGNVTMDWNWNDPCTGEVTHFTGKLKIRRGTGSGTWQDDCCGSGPWTATRTS
jgi:hypothetical protein